MMTMRRSATFVALAILSGNAFGWWSNECLTCGDPKEGGMYLDDSVIIGDYDDHTNPPYFYNCKYCLMYIYI